MKRTLTSLLFCALAIPVAMAQSLTLDNPPTDVYGFADSDLIGTHFNVMNTSSSAVDVLVQVEDNSYLTGSENYFCWKFCYPDRVRVSPDQDALTIAPSDTNFDFIGDYVPHGNVGLSTITYTFFNIADANDKRTATINYHSVLPVIAGSSTFCTGGSSTVGLQKEVYDGYLWSNGDTTPTTTISANGTYTVTVTLHDVATDTDDTRTAEISITESSNLNPLISGSVDYCVGENTTLDAGPGYASYLWSDGSTARTTTVTSGNVGVTVSDGTTCTGTTNVDITERPLPATPTISSSIEEIEIFGQFETKVVLTSSQEADYRWFYDGWFIYKEAAQTHVPDTKNAVSVMVIDQYGCSATSADFTPNNVGVEDFAALGMNIYPNPANEMVVLDYAGLTFGNGQIIVQNYLGTTVNQVTLSPMGRTEVSTSDLKAGIYFISVEIDNKISGTTQLVVTH